MGVAVAGERSACVGVDVSLKQPERWRVALEDVFPGEEHCARSDPTRKPRNLKCRQARRLLVDVHEVRLLLAQDAPETPPVIRVKVAVEADRRDPRLQA